MCDATRGGANCNVSIPSLFARHVVAAGEEACRCHSPCRCHESVLMTEFGCYHLCGLLKTQCLPCPERKAVIVVIVVTFMMLRVVIVVTMALAAGLLLAATTFVAF